MKDDNTIGCFNTSIGLWANTFRAYPKLSVAYMGDESGCAVYAGYGSLPVEHRATFPSKQAAIDCVNEARKQAGIE